MFIEQYNQYDEVLSTSSSVSGDGSHNSNDQQVQQTKDEGLSFRIKIKTEICKYWQENGHCPYQQECAFAHGSDQLRQKVHTHQLYRTKPCKNYDKNGCCQYGTRCQFLHTKHYVSSLPHLQFQNILDNIEVIFYASSQLRSPASAFERIRGTHN